MSDNIQYQLVQLEDLPDIIDQHQPLMFDTESDGFYGPIVLAQFFQEGWNEVLYVKDPHVEALKELLDEYHLVMQNGAYDISTVQMQTGTTWQPETWDDTFYLARLKFFKESSFSLDKIAEYVLGYDPYKKLGINKKAMQGAKWKIGKPVPEDQLMYAAIDVWHLLDVWKAVESFIEDTNYKLDMKFVKHCLDFQSNGFPVDENRRYAQHLKNELEIEEIACPINVNSWQQVRKYIKEDESDDLALARFGYLGNEKAIEVRRAKKLTKQQSFLNKFKSDDGKIYGFFSPSTRSGRSSCKGIKAAKGVYSKYQNLQQLPRKLKGVFGYTPDQGKVLIYADFSQLELRTAAAVIGETNMAKRFYKNEDLHTYTMYELGLDKVKHGRTITKTCNFNLLYGGSAGMLGSILLKDADIFMIEDELYRLKNRWLNVWTGVKKWQEKGREDWQRGIPWRTPLGRRYVGKMYTDQLNIQIQGTGADVAKFAMHKIMRSISKMDDVELNNFIHDSYFITTPNDPSVYKEVSEMLAQAMQSSWVELSKNFTIQDIPMPVDVKVGLNWGEIEDDINVIHSYTLN